MHQQRDTDTAAGNSLQRLYLFRLYRTNRKLFFVIISFVFATTVGNLLGYEMTPFFVWGMYSEKQTDPGYYDVQKVMINDNEIVDISAGYTPSARFLLNSPLGYYMDIKKNNGVDPTISFLQSKLKGRYSFVKPYESSVFNYSNRINAFLPWYSRYLQEVTNKQVNKVTIQNIRVHYLREKIIEDSSYIFATWAQ